VRVEEGRAWTVTQVKCNPNGSQSQVQPKYGAGGKSQEYGILDKDGKANCAMQPLLLPTTGKLCIKPPHYYNVYLTPFILSCAFNPLLKCISNPLLHYNVYLNPSLKELL
jgi:hypothetical protein